MRNTPRFAGLVEHLLVLRNHSNHHVVLPSFDTGFICGGLRRGVPLTKATAFSSDALSGGNGSDGSTASVTDSASGKVGSSREEQAENTAEFRAGNGIALQEMEEKQQRQEQGVFDAENEDERREARQVAQRSLSESENQASIAQAEAKAAGESCQVGTGGTCLSSSGEGGCEAFGQAVCDEGKCMCKPGFCAKDGRCLKTCVKDTGAACDNRDCEPWTHAECKSTRMGRRCVCPEGTCAFNGECKQRMGIELPPMPKEDDPVASMERTDGLAAEESRRRKDRKAREKATTRAQAAAARASPVREPLRVRLHKRYKGFVRPPPAEPGPPPPLPPPPPPQRPAPETHALQIDDFHQSPFKKWLPPRRVKTFPLVAWSPTPAAPSCDPIKGLELRQALWTIKQLLPEGMCDNDMLRFEADVAMLQRSPGCATPSEVAVVREQAGKVDVCIRQALQGAEHVTFQDRFQLTNALEDFRQTSLSTLGHNGASFFLAPTVVPLRERRGLAAIAFLSSASRETCVGDAVHLTANFL
eukprot:TRINITY_DN67239_c0_g1_i1.p1 TRINITY_DN67239_c0_g1~~TRINITY_DN67239_c0_g1_i1.p1  ORF type:complete len:529 (-),score=98.32 TRINITY_DN67239_c0_g1_i1:42-1628(-)